MKDNHPKSKKSRGFALISTIIIMSLLLLVAFGVINLSSVEARSNRTNRSNETAKANARLALMIAISELQEAVGPDQRITASGKHHFENPSHSHITGVYRSWGEDFDPLSRKTIDYDKEKRSEKDGGRFLNYLASNQDREALEYLNFADTGSFIDPVTLLGKNSLSAGAPVSDYLKAGKIILENSGAYAWSVMDDGQKARIDMNMQNFTDSTSIAEQSAVLGGAQRTALEKIQPDFNPVENTADKLLTLGQSNIGSKIDMKQFTHDLTTWSSSPMTSVTEGGLLRDLNLMTDLPKLPSAYLGKKIYSGGEKGIAPSDPNWNKIHSYSSLYKKMQSSTKPSIQAEVPQDYTPYSDKFEAELKPSSGIVLTPKIAKLQIVFSLLSRQMHQHWEPFFLKKTKDPRRRYLLHMVYSPIITLHNPYNVELKFDSMKLQFHNVPIAFKFFRNKKAQTHKFIPFNQLFKDQSEDSKTNKSFTMILKGKSTSDVPGGTITMKPGEVRVFSPYLPPGLTWHKDQRGDGVVYFDWRNDKTADFTAISGWRSETFGFDIDWITPANIDLPDNNDKTGVFSLRITDHIKVEYLPIAGTAAKNKFIISSEIMSGGKFKKSSLIKFNFGNKLAKILPAPDKKKYQYPQVGETPLTTWRIIQYSHTPIADYERIRAFCVFSAYAKTAKGGTIGGEEGRHAAKAWKFTSSSSPVVSIDYSKEHSAHHSHELNLEPLPGSADNYIEVDSQDRGNFITGHSPLNGIKFGTHYELPIAPIQSIAQLQHAGLANSGYLPKFDHPVANSSAHPLMPANKVKHLGKSGYDLLDHSYLLNHHLYDRFYCSSISAYKGGLFGKKGRDTKTVLRDYLRYNKPILNRQLIARVTGNKDVEAIVTEVTHPQEGYLKIANYQMMKGRFNINSLSIPAWKIILAGAYKNSFPVYDAKSGTVKTATNKAGALFSRFRLPNAMSNVNDKRARWAGYRELTDTQLEALATRIVAEVKERGPFLSLSEFVNRRLAGDAEMLNKGALQAAIDKTDINDVYKTDGIIITDAHIADHEYENPSAALGSSAAGAPGFLSQADLLTTLGNSISARSDTFTIRAYGETKGDNGEIVARAYCEAVVQRSPDYLDSDDENHISTAQLTSEINEKYGRKLFIVSFRWLSQDEI